MENGNGNEKNWKWIDAHFCRLPSQTNVYGLAKLSGPDGINKLLVTSIQGKVLSAEYQRVVSKLQPASKEIQFTYIPGDAEIVSIDAVDKCNHKNGLIIGITFLKVNAADNVRKPSSQFVNFYSSWIADDYSLDNVAQGCQSVELNFVPFQLLHTELVNFSEDLNEVTKETVFLLSGGDSLIHMYREYNEQHWCEEEENAVMVEYFPELALIDNIVLWLEIVYTNSYRERLSAVGYQNGKISVHKIDVCKKELLQTWTTEHDSAITSLRLFTIDNMVPCPEFISDKIKEEISIQNSDLDPKFDLLVTSALEPAFVYRNILDDGFKNALQLPDSEKFDIILCSCVADIDFDGKNEILLGSYGQELMAYKYIPATKSSSEDDEDKFTESTEKLRHRSHENTIPSAKSVDTSPTRRTRSEEDLTKSKSDIVNGNNSSVSKKPSLSCPQYKLLWQRSFANPVMCVDKADMVGDGIDELVVVTLKGIHILQPDLTEVSALCLERLTELTERCSISEPT